MVPAIHTPIAQCPVIGHGGMMAWIDMAWHDHYDDDDDRMSRRRRCRQFLLAEATRALPHDVAGVLSSHEVRACMLWSRDVVAVEGW